MRFPVFFAALTFLAGCNSVEPVRRTQSSPRPVEEQRPSKPRRAANANFDFYVLSMSWSPQHCATPSGERDKMQCAGGRLYDFVLHGLWPQNEKGWPADCDSRQVDRATVDSMLDIMPSPSLVRHEWRKHGTCSGLEAPEYFAEARRAFEAIRIPDAYKRPKLQVIEKPSEMRRKFEAANPRFTEESFAVVCSGRYLQEVRACLTQNFEPRPCNREVLRNQCRVDEMILRPVR
jgi:ribonuclease T2